MSRFRQLFVIASAGACALPMAGQVNFSQTVYQTPIGAPASAATADFNNQGTDDFVLAYQAFTSPSGQTTSPGGTIVYFTDSTGTVISQLTLNEGIAAQGQPGLTSAPVWVATADVNGDGNSDIIETQINGGPTGETLIYTGDGKGNFTQSQPIPLENPFDVSGPVVAADFQGRVPPGQASSNPYADLVIQECDSNGNCQYNVYLNQRNGSYQLTQSLIAPAGRIRQGVVPVVADFNGDGYQDVAFVYGNGGLAIDYGNGNGTFTLGKEITLPGGGGSLASADFNKDDLPDLVVRGFGSSGAQFWVYLNSGNGNFTLSDTLPAPSRPTSIITADLNGDGRQDFIYESYDANGNPQLSYALGNGKGQFPVQTSVSEPQGLSTGPLAVGLLTKTGRVDVVSGVTSYNFSNPQASYGAADVLLNAGNTP